MKILQIMYGIAGGGAPNVALTLAHKLKANGNDVHIVRVNVPYDNPKEQNAIKALEEKKINHYCLHRAHGSFGMNSFFKLVHLLQKENYDVIHSHLLIPDIYAAIAKIFIKKNIAHFITVHNTVAYHKKWLINSIFRKSTFIKCSPAIKSISKNVDEFTIPNSIKIEEFSPFQPPKTNIKHELKLKENDFVITVVGNLRVQKNQIIAIKMLSVLKFKYHYNNIRLVICGDGELRQNLEMESFKLGVQDSVSFLGLRDDVSEIIKSSDVFMSSSLWEGLPISVLEAFSTGIITVLSPINEHVVISKKMSHVYLTNGLTELSFAEQIIKLLPEILLYSKKEIFKSRIEELHQYSEDIFFDAHVNLYKQYI